MEKINFDDTILKEKRISAYYILLFAICFLSTVFGGAVSTLMSVYLPVVLKDLSMDKSPKDLNDISAYINAVFIFGWTFGGFLWGIISDRMGRKKSLLSSIAFYGIFTVLTGMMPNWWSIVICRFLSGFGVGGVLVVSVILMSEVWPSRSKAIYIGILSIGFPIGIFSAGLINYIVAYWRLGFFVGFFPILISIVSIFILKESPGWRRDKTERAISGSLKKSAFSKDNRRSMVFGSIIFGSMLIGLWAIFSWLPTWVQSLITGSDAQKERGLSMMFMGMGGLLGGFLSGWLVNLAGIRKSMLICFSVCAFLSFILFKTNTVFSNLVYVEIAVLALFFGGSQGTLSVFIPHLFPTGIRASSTGFCFNVGRIFTASAVLFIGILVTTLGGYGNAIFIFSLVFVIGLAVILFTKDQSYEYAQETTEMNTAGLSTEIA